MIKRITILFIGLLLTIFSADVFAQDVEEDLGERITQEEFAVELCLSMNMSGWLPTAALSRDCVELLESMGIAPLTGWNNKAFLSQEDYLTILAKVHGKETMLHDRARAVEEKNIEVINEKWHQTYQEKGRWVPLEELLNDPVYFPKGAPLSPYGVTYRDQDDNHKVDPLFLPAAYLIEFREKLTLP